MAEKNRRSQLRRLMIAIATVLGFVAAATGLISYASTSPPPVPLAQQDVIRLETRLNQMEQRFYTLESSVRSLEQQARASGGGLRNGGDDEVRLLRSEIDLLQRRLTDVECGLAKVDERTLTPAMRAARKRAAGDDPCRLNFDSPLRVPSQ